jgi:hypothetical protein
VSSNVFPILPLVQPGKSARASYATRDLVAVSGKRVSAAWRSSAIRRIQFTVKLRTWKYCPSPWAAYLESDLLDLWVTTHKGKWDSWLLDNSTGLYWRGGPSQPRVRFVTDEPEIDEEQPGLYVANLELETVL